MPHPDPSTLSEQQLAGIACVECGANDVSLYDAGTIQLGGNGAPVQVLPVAWCWDHVPPARRMRVITSSAGGAQ